MPTCQDKRTSIRTPTGACPPVPWRRLACHVIYRLQPKLCLFHLSLSATPASYQAVVMPQLRATSTDAYENNAMELGSIRRAPSIPFLDEGASGPSSLRSSLDSGSCQSQGCDVHMYDDAPAAPSESLAGTSQRLNTSSWYGGLGESEDLKEHLKVSNLRRALRFAADYLKIRDPHRSRWM